MVDISFEWIGPDRADELSGIAYRVFMEVYTYEREDVVREFLDENQSPEAIRRQMLEGMSYAYIVSDGARIGYVGFVMEGDSMHLSKLYVFDGFRDRGIGSAAMDMVEAIARERGASSIHLDANGKNSGALSLYRRKGYVETGRVGKNYLRVDLRKPLNPDEGSRRGLYPSTP